MAESKSADALAELVDELKSFHAENGTHWSPQNEAKAKAVRDDLELLYAVRRWLLFFYDGKQREFASEVEVNNRYALNEEDREIITGWLGKRY